MTPDGFFRSGDIGIMDKDGYTKIVDRKKDMILVSGFNVYPNEIEGVVAGHAGVLECAAGWRARRELGRGGEALRRQEGSGADRARRDGVLQGTPDRLQEAEVRRVPRRLPRPSVGKILRRELRDIPGKKAA